jgi:large subunit ribosomal protein L12
MEVVYSALLLHKAGKPVDEENINKVLQAAGVSVDESKVKSLVISLKDVDIDKELESAVIASAASAGADSVSGEEVKAEETPKEEKAESSAEGLASLFG